MLGPVRFAHIKGCAREAVGRWKADRGKGVEGRAVRRRKAEDGKETVEKEALVTVLKERDHSVSALRGLLREKKEEASAAKADEGTSGVKDVNTTPAKAVNYSAMPLEALRRLGEARDATIAWILKEIEKVEQEQELGKAKDTG